MKVNCSPVVTSYLMPGSMGEVGNLPGSQAGETPGQTGYFICFRRDFCFSQSVIISADTDCLVVQGKGVPCDDYGMDGRSLQIGTGPCDIVAVSKQVMSH